MAELTDEQKQKNFFSHYVVEDPNFSKGSYGKVVLARDFTGKRVVIKMIPVQLASKWIHHELEAGNRLTHPNIPKLCNHLSTTNFHYLVFDFFKGLELYELLEMQEFKPVPENDVKLIFHQLLSALNYSHKSGIAHRDIKLENILVNRQLKLALVDFGLCSVNTAQEYQTKTNILSREFVGSENYTAPEIIKRTSYDPFKAEIWSLGVVLYSLLFGQFPWDDITKYISPTTDQIRIRFPKEVNVTDPAKQLLVQMLTVNPEKRVSLQEVISHEWLQSLQLQMSE